jgi:trimeric autotransporter adhesin
MSLILSGTDGLSEVDGTAATPAIRGTDANTGIFFGTDIIGFSEGGAEAMRIDSSGNVGIGTTSLDILDQAGASRPLVVKRSDSSTAINSSTASIAIVNGDTTTSNTAQLNFAAITGANTSGYSSAVISCIFGARTNGQYPTGILTFSTSTLLNAAPTEKMRIDSSGNVLIGATSYQAKLTVYGTAISNTGVGSFWSTSASDIANPAGSFVKYDNNSTTSQIFVKFGINQYVSGSGQINANGANAAAFGSFSDRRLKENIVDLPSQLANIMALRPVEFDYIESEGGGHQIGFIAQEVQEVYSDLVGERSDGMLTLSDFNKNDARLIKCIQEQQALITALTARITALETP